MNVATAIVGHVKRMDLIAGLTQTLRPDYLFIDDGSLECFGNHLRAWACLARTRANADWCVVLEDDAVPVQCFDDQLAQALEVSPSPVVSLYLGTNRPRDVQGAIRRVMHTSQTCWITTQRMLHAVGIAIRGSLVHSMVEHIRTSEAVFLPIDRAIGHWVEREGYTVAYTRPSLVDHADVDTVIDTHPDGQGRGRWVEGPDGMPIMQIRRAWCAGIRERWDSNAIGLETCG